MTDRKPLVLVVDDGQDLRETLADLLTEYGFSAVAAGTGKEALSIIESRRPDAAIVDLTMPDMDGFELTTRLRACQPDLPIMAYTGWSGEAMERRAREAGCISVLLKSVEPTVIVSSLKAVLETRLRSAPCDARRA